MKTQVIAIVGATASGKSQLAIALAKHFPAEIISADAMQFYRGMDIGTAKIVPLEQEGITHHLIDILDPETEFSVADYQKMVRAKIAELKAKGVMPILVGGSGLYLQAVLYDYQFVGDRRHYEEAEAFPELSDEELHHRLFLIDPNLASTIHPHNRRRILRSLEIAGENLQESRAMGKRLFYPDALIIALDLDRKTLYERIDKRVDQMIASGLVDEVRNLIVRPISMQSMKAIGYKELISHLQGEITLEQAIDEIKQNSRRYAKRQLTWFKNKMDPYWLKVDPDNFTQTLSDAISIIEKKV